MLCACLLIFIPFAHADTARIAVAANFKEIMRLLTPVFEEQTGHQLSISYGSTGKLFAQISNGAPFDVFLAADSHRPALAEDQKLAVPGTHFVYAGGRLVLWSPATSRFKDGEAFLLNGSFNKLAIGNPRTAPYGLAAKQALQSIGAWDRLEQKLVRGDSIAQAFQFVATGNAEIGLVAHAQVLSWKESGGSLWVVPGRYHEPINQSAVLLERGRQNPAALEFIEFLAGPEARAIIRSGGYEVPEGQ